MSCVAGARLRPQLDEAGVPRPRQPAGAVRRGGGGIRRGLARPGRPGCGRCAGPRSAHNTYRISTAVLRTHEAPTFPGGMIASLSSPGAPARATTTSAATIWSGRATWSRPPAACSRPAPRRTRGACSTICAPSRSRTATGRRTAGWTARPIGTACRWTNAPSRSCWSTCAGGAGALPRRELADYWPMVRARRRLRAAATARSPARTAGRRMAATRLHPGGRSRRAAGRGRPGRRARGEPAASRRSCATPRMPGTTAIEDWLLRAGQPARPRRRRRRAITSASPRRSRATAASDVRASIVIKNRAAGQHRTGRRTPSSAPTRWRWSASACARADDPRIVDTVKVIDARTAPSNCRTARAGTATTSDGYGEHEDGSAFDGTGIGRLWPLLTGERAHYELAAGRRDGGAALLATMEA